MGNFADNDELIASLQNTIQEIEYCIEKLRESPINKVYWNWRDRCLETHCNQCGGFVESVYVDWEVHTVSRLCKECKKSTDDKIKELAHRKKYIQDHMQLEQQECAAIDERIETIKASRCAGANVKPARVDSQPEPSAVPN